MNGGFSHQHISWGVDAWAGTGLLNLECDMLYGMAWRYEFLVKHLQYFTHSFKKAYQDYDNDKYVYGKIFLHTQLSDLQLLKKIVYPMTINCPILF